MIKLFVIHYQLIMDENWNQRLIGVVPDIHRAAASELLVNETHNSSDMNSFSIPLSVSGAAPATHWGCSSACHEALREKLAEQLSQRKIPARFLILEIVLGDNWKVIRASSQDEEIIGRFYTPWEAFDKAIEAFGLKRIINLNTSNVPVIPTISNTLNTVSAPIVVDIKYGKNPK